MPTTIMSLLLLAALILASLAPTARAEPCEPQWAEGFGLPGLNGDVNAVVSWDDGSGPALYAGGGFTTAGGVPASRIAKWDGTAWSPLTGPSGQGVSGTVRALSVFDDGSGPALYVGGHFTTAGGVAASRIAKWDGSDWSPLTGPSGQGVDSWVNALSVFDDGSGPALYAGGRFTTADGVEASRIAKWDGTDWSPLTGPSGQGMDSEVRALSVYDDGSGPALYVGGYFTTAGGVEASYIAKWDGTAWSPLTGLSGQGVSGTVRALSVFDDGTAPALYAGGHFTTAGGVESSSIAKWDGTAWSPLTGPSGQGMNGTVSALSVFDDGTGPALYAGGLFTTAGGVTADRIARWDGSAWTPLGSGMNGGNVYALTTFDDGSGPALYAGGNFTTAGGVPANYIAKWNSTAWSPLGSGMNGSVLALTVFDDGSGPALYAGGLFTTAGGVPTNYIAKWNSTAWSPLGSGMNGSVLALTVFNDGSGPALYAGGLFTTAGGEAANRIARWDGSAWTPLGSGMSGGNAYALTTFDDGSGPALYAGGNFTTAGGVADTQYIARWDGSDWSPLRSGVGGFFPDVRTLTVFDDGSGPALYAGGLFTTAGGEAANRIARWDGSAWTPLGSGMSDGYVYALTTFDDGSGPALYAGGNFTTAGGVPANRIAKWDDTVWSPLGSGMSGGSPTEVRALTVFDDGSGPALYAGGEYATAGGVPARHIARWNGSVWSPLGSGISGISVRALKVFDDGSGPALYAGGDFTTAGGLRSSRIAKWTACPPDPSCNAADLAEPFGLLDLADLVAFATAFSAQDPAADLAEPFGVLDLADVVAFVTAFEAGCP